MTDPAFPEKVEQIKERTRATRDYKDKRDGY